VFFTSTAGSLADSVVNTSADGSARTTLTTSVQATVTATVGVQGTGGATGGTGSTGGTSGTAAGTVVVNVSVAPTLVITPPTAPPSVGVPANFTFVVTAATANGSAVRNVHVDWGDGSSRDLGAITGTSIQSHVYQDDGTFTVTATVTDAIGNSQMVSASVTVIPVPRPSININFTPANPIAGNLINFTIQIVAAPGIGIVRTTIDFGDGDVRSLGGASSVTVQKAYASAGTRTVRVLVEDTTGQVTEGTTIVSVSP
jgi:PKD repeat protein